MDEVTERMLDGNQGLVAALDLLVIEHEKEMLAFAEEKMRTGPRSRYPLFYKLAATSRAFLLEAQQELAFIRKFYVS
jgi:hypothetical protein